MINLYGNILTDIDWLTSRDETFRYMMLDRLRSDCDYFLGYGDCALSIVGNSIFYHIRKMKALWISLPEKPEWLSYFEILQYQDKMSKALKEKYAVKNKEALATINEAIEKLKSMPKTDIKKLFCEALEASGIDYYILDDEIIIK